MTDPAAASARRARGVPGSDCEPAVDDDSTQGAPRYPIGAVDRTLLALELLVRKPELRLSEIRAELSIGQSSAHRLMAMLTHRGFAERDPISRGYRAGPVLNDIGRTALEGTSVTRRARPVLQWLAEESGETVHLAVLNGLFVRYVDVVESEAALRVTGRVGRVTPAHATSQGKAMLAHLGEAAIRRMYADVELDTPTDRTICDLETLLAELAKTRNRGWARNRSEMEPGVCSVAIGLHHQSRGLLGGLSIATPSARSSAGLERRHVQLLRSGRQQLFDAMEPDPPQL